MDFSSRFNLGVIHPEWLRAGGLFAAFLVLAFAVSLVWHKTIDKFVAKTKTPLDDMIFEAVRGLIIWGLILSGAHFAFVELSATQTRTVVWTLLGKGFTICWIFLLISTTLRLLNTFSRWKISQASTKEGENPRDVITRATFLRKLATAVVALFGGLYILSVAGIDISPIIAGGALSGIVIGIALQDTLSNIFAGFFLNFDRPVKIGDFIRIDGNQEGYVEEVGWRYSRVRLIGNNLLVIPNNKLSQSLITNYSLVGHAISLSVHCPIAYDNDLEKVETVALEAVKKLQDSSDDDDPFWEPQIRFRDFGGDSISMVVVLRSKEVASQNQLQHRFIKVLHQAFRQQGIKMPK